VRLWDYTTKTTRAWRLKSDPADPGGYDIGCINVVKFTEDGEHAVLGAGGIHWTDVVHDVGNVPAMPATGDELSWETPHTGVAVPFADCSGEVFALDIASDDSLAVAGGGGLEFYEESEMQDYVNVWDLTTREMRFPLRGHRAGVTGVAIGKRQN